MRRGDSSCPPPRQKRLRRLPVALVMGGVRAVAPRLGFQLSPCRQGNHPLAVRRSDKRDRSPAPSATGCWARDQDFPVSIAGALASAVDRQTAWRLR